MNHVIKVEHAIEVEHVRLYCDYSYFLPQRFLADSLGWLTL